MYTSSNPRLFSRGSATIHIRSSPATCCEYGLGGPNVVPPSFDLPVVMLARVRLEYAKPSSDGAPNPGRAAVSWGPIAQSQSPPPAVLSGYPRKLEAEPSCLTLNALQPAGTPVGAITKDWPNRSVRMLGSAAFELLLRRRFGLKVAGAGAAARADPRPTMDTVASIVVAATIPMKYRWRCVMIPPSPGQPERCKRRRASAAPRGAGSNLPPTAGRDSAGAR